MYLEKPMLHILFGEDDFSINEALELLKQSVGSPDVLDANITRSNAASLSPQELLALCNTVPFLASRRMVVVDGLLGLFEGRRQQRRGSRGSGSENSTTTSWLSIEEYIPTFPPTTDLVLVDGAITRENRLLGRLSSLGQVREFQTLRGAELNRWIQDRASEKRCNISNAGIRLLAELVGGNLWSLSSEVEKLSLYCQGRTVEPDDIRLLVSFARETVIFSAVDAIVEGRHTDALRFIRHLTEGGAIGPYIVIMVARQVRLLLLAKDMEEQRVPQGQIGERLGITSGFVLRKIREQARRYTQESLEALHRGLLETDLAMKTGGLSEEAVGEFLVEVFTQVSLTQRTAR